MARNGETVLVIPDIHCPFEHKYAFDFLRRVKSEFSPSFVVCLGDEIDFHAISNHDHDPDGLSAGDEFREALEHLKELYSLFPRVAVCVSNHTARPFRMAFSSGMPKQFIKDYKTLLEAPVGWSWHDRIIIDNVLYIHGEGYSGKDAHMKAAYANRMSTVIGHVHSHAGVAYSKSFHDKIFAMNAGCLINEEKYAFKYGKHLANRPTVGCGIVNYGRSAHFIPLDVFEEFSE